MRDALLAQRSKYVLEVADIHERRAADEKRLIFLRGALAATNDALKEAEKEQTS